MTIKLSICIPTFNRANYLKFALNSIYCNIINDYKDILEIVVSDNCSTDETESIANSFKGKMPVRFSKNIENVGAEKNYRKAFSLARGEYVWFFCDDDVIVDGAITYLLNFLLRNSGIGYIYYPRILSDKNLLIVNNEIRPSGLDGDRTFDSGYTLLQSYDNQLTSLIGFLGSNIIKQSLFEKSMHNMNEEDISRQWTFLRIIFKAITDQKCAVLGTPGIICRLSNSRPFTAINSETWFDDYIALYEFAKDIGYSENMCNETIQGIIRSFSKMFVVDKAKGNRNDNISLAAEKLGISHLVVRRQPWYFLSFLPPKLLNLMMKNFLFLRALYRHGYPA